ncbi:MAG: bifunctional adenosylcobinamide kinase/adenosylcobinamide-phosphate guanylyltransferase [Pirellulaceae bacterium]
MGRIVLVTGGARSGKSAFAQKLAESLTGRRAYVATGEPGDEEMRERIRKHRQARAGTQWDTIEEPVHLSRALSLAARYDVVLVDCLTLWVSNVIHEGRPNGTDVNEEHMAERCQDVLAACDSHPGTVVFVTNEVGMGIVPESALARLFRDLIGRCNQIIAAAADEVTLLSCGIPISLKG